MDDWNWYVNLMNYLDNKAKENHLLNRVEIEQLNICVDRYSVADSVTELIRDIADANNCGNCRTWNELIIALRNSFETGERIAI